MENKAIFMTGLNKMETRVVPMPKAPRGRLSLNWNMSVSAVPMSII